MAVYNFTPTDFQGGYAEHSSPPVPINGIDGSYAVRGEGWDWCPFVLTAAVVAVVYFSLQVDPTITFIGLRWVRSDPAPTPPTIVLLNDITNPPAAFNPLRRGQTADMEAIFSATSNAAKATINFEVLTGPQEGTLFTEVLNAPDVASPKNIRDDPLNGDTVFKVRKIKDNAGMGEASDGFTTHRFTWSTPQTQTGNPPRLIPRIVGMATASARLGVRSDP